MANAGNEARAGFIEGRASGDAAAHWEVNHAGFVLHRCRGHFPCFDVGLHEGGGSSVGEQMEYAIGGVTAVFLFIYLLYALLRPERF